MTDVIVIMTKARILNTGSALMTSAVLSHIDQSQLILTRQDLASFDFLDFGCGKGASFSLGESLAEGAEGLGLEIDKSKIDAMGDAGRTCIEADITRLNIDADSVRFVILGHVLEHLQSLDEIQRVLKTAVTAARDFLLIHGPIFDSDNQLTRHGLKFYWSDWSKHTTHLTMLQLESILGRLEVEEWVVMGRGLVWNSDSGCVHGLESPPNQWDHNPKVHPAKPYVEFSPPLFREYVCCVRLTPDLVWHALITKIKEKMQCMDREIRDFFG